MVDDTQTLLSKITNKWAGMLEENESTFACIVVEPTQSVGVCRFKLKSGGEGKLQMHIMGWNSFTDSKSKEYNERSEVLRPDRLEILRKAFPKSDDKHQFMVNLLSAIKVYNSSDSPKTVSKSNIMTDF